MAFELKWGPAHYMTVGWLGSSSIVKGALCRFDQGTGYLEPSTVGASKTTDAVQFAVNLGETQTASSTNGATTTVVCPLLPGQVWKVDTTSALLQTQVGKICSLTDASTIDEDDTGNWPICEIVGYEGALADKKAYVRFIWVPAVELATASENTLASGIVAIGV